MKNEQLVQEGVVSDSSFETEYKTTPTFLGTMEEDTQYAITSDCFKEVPYKRAMIKLKKVDLKKLEERIEKNLVEILEKKFEERRKEEDAIREKKNTILEKKNAIREKKNAIWEKKNDIREKQFSILKRKITILQDKTVILAKQSSNFENMNTLLEAKS